MFLQGWVIGWMIQLAVALLLWLPLALFSGGAGSWDRAWAVSMELLRRNVPDGIQIARAP